VRELFGVLEAAERWLAATGHPDWRAAILSERALTHRMLGETNAAVAAAEEALAVATQHPDAPGYTLNSHRYQLGDILRDARRAAEAAPHYQAILADPDATPWERRAAHEGLAWCALAAGDPDTACREARTAVLLAESLDPRRRRTPPAAHRR
jgi:tetratricopeptide (TPR) repeat protein